MQSNSIETLPEIHKVCTKCKISKPLSAYHKQSNGAYQKKAECKICMNIRKSIHQKKTLHLVRGWRLNRLYGLTDEDYNKMLVSQGNACAICERPVQPSSKKHHAKYLAVDHCHTTKKIRGLLCHTCNRGLGIFLDNPEILRKAANYLEAAR